MFHTLTRLSSGELAPLPGSLNPQKSKYEFYELPYPTFRPTFSQQSHLTGSAAAPLKRFLECKSLCTENVCSAEQSLGRKATRGN